MAGGAIVSCVLVIKCMPKEKTQKQKIGQLGEDIACKFLVKQGYTILERNYWKKWGEIDVVAQKGDILHFIEVKTVGHKDSRETPSNSPLSRGRMWGSYQPEDNVHPWKLKRLSRVIQTYLLSKKVSDLPSEVLTKEGEIRWQVDIMAVFLDFNTRKAKIRVTEDIGL